LLQERKEGLRKFTIVAKSSSSPDTVTEVRQIESDEEGESERGPSKLPLTAGERGKNQQRDREREKAREKSGVEGKTKSPYELAETRSKIKIHKNVREHIKEKGKKEVASSKQKSSKSPSHTISRSRVKTIDSVKARATKEPLFSL
jgi:hypothetical protein